MAPSTPESPTFRHTQCAGRVFSPPSCTAGVPRSSSAPLCPPQREHQPHVVREDTAFSRWDDDMTPWPDRPQAAALLRAGEDPFCAVWMRKLAAHVVQAKTTRHQSTASWLGSPTWGTITAQCDLHPGLVVASKIPRLPPQQLVDSCGPWDLADQLGLCSQGGRQETGRSYMTILTQAPLRWPTCT